MIHETWAIAITIMVVFVALVGSIYLGIAHSNDKHTEQMKSCVAAGKDWVKDSRNRDFICVAAGS